MSARNRPSDRLKSDEIPLLHLRLLVALHGQSPPSLDLQRPDVRKSRQLASANGGGDQHCEAEEILRDVN